MNRSQKQVKEFHKAFNLPISDFPRQLELERKHFRADLIQEELDEFLEADGKGIKNFVDEIDALIDLLYFTYGTLIEMGVDAEEVFDIVQECNMAKLGPNGKPIYREDGKVLKPEGWTGPERNIENYIVDEMRKHKVTEEEFEISFQEDVEDDKA